MNENEEIPRIEPAPYLPPEPPVVKAPDMTPKAVVLPVSVVNAIKMRHEQMAEAELNALQRLYRDGKLDAEQIAALVQSGIIQEPKTIFQIIQENGMKAIIATGWNYVTGNLRTLITGLVFLITQLSVKYGIEVPALLSDTLYGIAYIFIFNMADRKVSPQLILGAVLTVLSLFLNPLAGWVGVATNPLIMSGLQFGMQSLVAVLLKDQKDFQEIARRTGALPVQMLVLLFLGTSALPVIIYIFW